MGNDEKREEEIEKMFSEAREMGRDTSAAEADNTNFEPACNERQDSGYAPYNENEQGSDGNSGDAEGQDSSYDPYEAEGQDGIGTIMLLNERGEQLFFSDDRMSNAQTDQKRICLAVTMQLNGGKYNLRAKYARQNVSERERRGEAAFVAICLRILEDTISKMPPEQRKMLEEILPTIGAASANEKN